MKMKMKMKKIYITGGGFSNKGAEAMLYITLLKCLERFPDPLFLLQISGDIYEAKGPEDLKKIKSSLKTGKSRKSFVKQFIDQCKKIRSSHLLIDISGFELTSKFRSIASLKYLLRIISAKFFKVPVYIMPQSFGPFEYQGFAGKFILMLIRKYMSYPKVVFAREAESFKNLKRVCPKCNLKLSKDIVLQTNTDEYIKNIKSAEEIEASIPNQGCVGIIPNIRLQQHGEKGLCIQLFCDAIGALLKSKRGVFLLCHSSEDKNLCEQIKSYFRFDDRVKLIDREFSCFEFERIVKKFDYIIASRYHSIVHAYKQGIPCIALGWASKYKELLESFGQEQFLLEISSATSESIRRAIELMEQTCVKERTTISELLVHVQKDNCFKVLDETF